METIIGLLFILLPVIFKLIGKRLEASGNQDKARKVREIAQVLVGDEEQTSEEISDVPRQIEPVPIPDVPAPAVEGKPSATRKPMLVEEEAKQKGEKIDPKKLVIYSEIMKPKF